MNKRIIPCLLLREGGLWKTERFADPRYVGDPINVIRVFNDKEVDELALLDIGATRDTRGIDFQLIENVASECFMPLCYGGGIRTVDDAARLFDIGLEKVAVNTAAFESPDLIGEIAERFGSQSVVVSIDVRSGRRSRTEVYTAGGTKRTGLSAREAALWAEGKGAGEILLTSVDREGTRRGYDLDLIRDVSGAVGIPVIAHGGAASYDDLVEGVSNGASAVAAGSLFVFHGRHRAVLISYPNNADRALIEDGILAGRSE